MHDDGAGLVSVDLDAGDDQFDPCVETRALPKRQGPASWLEDLKRARGDCAVDLCPNYPVVTSRLRLRPLKEGDLDALLSYHSSEDVHRFLPMQAMDAENILERIRQGSWSRSTLLEEGQILMLGVELAGSEELVGDVMLRWTSARDRSGELGYVLHPSFGGQGYATEAATEVLRLAFEEMGLHRVFTRIDIRNGPSIALSERIGMRREAHLVENAWLQGEWADEVDFAMLEREWGQLHDHE